MNLPPAYNAATGKHPPPYKEQKQKALRLDRKEVEDHATLISIVRVLDVLESSLNKDLVDEKTYNSHCSKLLKQLFNQKRGIESEEQKALDIPKFLDSYGYECGNARARIKVGVPEDWSHSGGGNKSVAAFEMAQYFITAKDALEMEYKEVDQLLPLISDIVQSVNKIDIPHADPAYRAKEKILEWNARLHSMKAVDLLSDGDIRQLKMDLETSQSAMYVFLGASGGSATGAAASPSRASEASEDMASKSSGPGEEDALENVSKVGDEDALDSVYKETLKAMRALRKFTNPNSCPAAESEDFRTSIDGVMECFQNMTRVSEAFSKDLIPEEVLRAVHNNVSPADPRVSDSLAPRAQSRLTIDEKRKLLERSVEDIRSMLRQTESSEMSK
eukprot:g2844.t1